MKSDSPRAHGLDTLRALAIFAVIVFHVSSFHGRTLPDAVRPAARLGWMGVDLFFVLSGYLIGSQLLRPYRDGKRPSVWGFYRNRLFRILPAYAVVLALYFLVPGWTEDTALAPLWQYCTFTFNLFVDYANFQGFSHVWSLCVEEHFYLLLPLIVLGMMRRPSLRRTVVLIAGLVLLGISIRSFVLFHELRPLAQAGAEFGVQYMEHLYYPTYSHFDGLLAGVALALVRMFRPRWWTALTRRGHALLVAAACVLATAVVLFRERYLSASGTAAIGDVIGFPLLSIGLALLVASALSENGWLRLRVPGARLVAALAYSLYLTHKALIHLVDLWFPWAERAGWLTWMAVYATCCLAAASLLYLCVERPFLILRDKRMERS